MLTLCDVYPSSGRYEATPIAKIIPHSTSGYSSESRVGSLLTGTSGSTFYAIGNGKKYLAVYYSCPSIDSYKVNATIFTALMPHDAEIWFDVLKNGGTESTTNKMNCGLNISYLTGQQSTITLTHA